MYVYGHECKCFMSYLIEVFSCGPHLLPGFIKQLNADTEELLPRTVMSEEHGVVVIAALISYTKDTISNDFLIHFKIVD